MRRPGERRIRKLMMRRSQLYPHLIVNDMCFVGVWWAQALLGIIRHSRIHGVGSFPICQLCIPPILVSSPGYKLLCYWWLCGVKTPCRTYTYLVLTTIRCATSETSNSRFLITTIPVFEKVDPTNCRPLGNSRIHHATYIILLPCQLSYHDWLDFGSSL